jgi:hypothetical protein
VSRILVAIIVLMLAAQAVRWARSRRRNTPAQKH